MNILDGINNFLTMINDNWTSIIVCIGLVMMIVKKCTSYFEKSDDEKIEIAKGIIQRTMLEYVSNAEKDYAEWKKAGAAKRAQVIAKVYADYPVLGKVVDQEMLISWIDELIEQALEEMRKMIKEA